MLPTPAGSAHIDLNVPIAPVVPLAVALLGHGAGGGVDAPDVRAAGAALLAAGVAVGRFTQPYRVAGRRAPAPAAALDAAFLAGVGALRARPGLGGVPLIAGGRSSGARVACRTAERAGAVAVLALAFPLMPPGRPDRSRLPELLAVGRPTLVVQGSRDGFGGAGALTAAVGAAGPWPPWLRIAAVEGADHGFRARRADGRTSADCLAEIAAAVRDCVTWLSRG
ncbi:MAG: alpha/beta family hydrolase [Frankiaceae bacterium]